MRNFLPIISRALSTLCALSILMMLVLAAPVRSQGIDEIVAEFSSYGDRSSGSEGSARTADFIADYFTALGLVYELVVVQEGQRDAALDCTPPSVYVSEGQQPGTRRGRSRFQTSRHWR